MTDNYKNKFSKKKKAAIIAGGVILSLLFALLIYLSVYYRAKEVAKSALTETKAGITLSFDADCVAFEAKDATKGVILYPGAKVEYTAYAPLAKKIAEGGVLCVIPHLTGNMAFFEANAADEIMKNYPEIKEWFLAGHSLGGAMASTYAYKRSDQLSGLILLAAYSTKDLSKSGLNVLLIKGSEDKVINENNYEKYKINLPSDYEEIVIEGGCHAYFGDYGAQRGDGDPAITLEEQLEITAQGILDFLRR